MNTMPERADPLGGENIAAWHDHVILCGLGSTGVRVAEGLIQAGVRTVVVDNERGTAYRRVVARHGVPVVDGDCTEPETLHRAGVSQATAVIVMINHDMVSLQTALTVHELNPRARVVIRLFNLRMGQHLRDLPAGIIALSLSAVAAPIFTLAARCRALCGAFTLDGATWAIGNIAPPRPELGTYAIERWRQLGMVTLACITSDDRLILCPSPEYVPLPGSRVLVAAKPAQLEALADDPRRLARALHDPDAEGRLQDQTPGEIAHRPRRVTDALHPLRVFWQDANHFLRLAVLALLLLVAASVLIFHFFVPLHFVDALYFTVSLVTTVGLGDFNVAHTGAPLKLFVAFVMLSGAILMAVVYGLIAEFVLNQRIQALFGERVEALENHYVVAGLGTIGFRMVQALREAGEPVMVIESADNGRFIPQLRALKVPLVIGDTVFEETLRRARITQARAFIAVTSNDLVNIEAVLNARAMQPDGHVVLRVFDPDLATQARQGLAIPSSFSPAQIGAPAFISAALGHEVLQIISLPLDRKDKDKDPCSLAIVHLQAVEGDALCGRQVGEVSSAHGGTALIHQMAGAQDGAQFAPSSDRRLGPGDLLVLAVPHRGSGTPPAREDGQIAEGVEAELVYQPAMES